MAIVYKANRGRGSDKLGSTATGQPRPPRATAFRAVRSASTFGAPVEPASSTQAAAFLRRLSGVITKTEFGNEAFFVAANRFAAVTAQAVLLRLAPADLTEALQVPGVRPFVSVGAMGRHSWIEIRPSVLEPATLERLMMAAHAAALHGHRRSAVKKPSRARHVRSKRPT